ncbi:MAG TPA: response regulator [Bryobacteraceae bacterium]
METQLRKVLCIDDDPDILVIARIALEAFGGLSLLTSENGRDGVREAAAWQPDLIIMDVMMPELDGPATLKLLREQEESSASATRIPVIFMTARAEQGQVDHYLSLGAAAVIPKPFDPMTLSKDLVAIWQRIPVDALTGSYT